MMHFPLPSVPITTQWKKSWKYEKQTINIDIRIISYLQKNIFGYLENFFPNFPWFIAFKTTTCLTFPEFPSDDLNLIWFFSFPWFSRSAGILMKMLFFRWPLQVSLTFPDLNEKNPFPPGFPWPYKLCTYWEGGGGIKGFSKRRGNPRRGDYLKSGGEIPSVNYGLLKFNLPSNSIFKKSPLMILFFLTFIMVVLF